MKRVICHWLTAALIAAGTLASQVHASVVVAGTRVIYPSQEREVSVKLNNNGSTPALVQVWMDDGDMNKAPEHIRVPFAVTPALFRLDSNKAQTLRVTYTKEPLPADKESLYWLNVLEVPPKADRGADANVVQLAFRTRIKLIFRPQGLPGKVEEAPTKVTWQLTKAADGDGYVLKAVNPTPYVVNLGSVTLNAGGKAFDAGAGFIKPGESALFPVKQLSSPPTSGGEVEFSAINDWGGNMPGKHPLGGSTP